MTGSEPSPARTSALFTDLYELTMVQAYLHEQMHATAVFELYFRELPAERNFALVAGLGPLLDMVEGLRFSEEDLRFLRQQQVFDESLLNWLGAFRFTGDVDAMPEGTVAFPGEPLVRVSAPMPQAQLLETLVLNQIHCATVAASKAARVLLAAGGRSVIDFGSRRAHGIDAGLTVARSAYLAGFAGTSLVEAGQRYGIPLFGTMAHSYVQAHADEAAAFASFVRSFPRATLLVDTYDTLEGVRRTIELSRRLGEAFQVQAVRLDSGDLEQLARASRQMLDAAGLNHVRIIASGGLNEHSVRRLADDTVPIDAFGVGTALATSEDAPALDMAYKLVEYAGVGRTKLSARKLIYPGAKQVFRQTDGDLFQCDIVARADAQLEGEPLLAPMVRGGRRLEAGCESLTDSRLRAARQLAQLPHHLREPAAAKPPYHVAMDSTLQVDLDRLRVQLKST